MKLDLATTVARYANTLATLDHLLTAGEAHGSGDDMLEWRLAPDMFPLRRQVQFVINLAVQWASRAAGLPVPPSVEGESTLGELRTEIAKARDTLANIGPEHFAGRDDEPLEVDLNQIKPTMPVGQWIAGFATTNFYFHFSIVYAILRANGVPIGKRDLFAGGL